MGATLDARDCLCKLTPSRYDGFVSRWPKLRCPPQRGEYWRAHVRVKMLCFNKLQISVQCRMSAPPLLNSGPNSPQEAGMFIWVVILAMAVVGGYWVKTRRQRKTKAATYAGN